MCSGLKTYITRIFITKQSVFVICKYDLFSNVSSRLLIHYELRLVFIDLDLGKLFFVSAV